MKFSLLLSILLFSISGHSYTGDGMPFKYISSCEIDLNGDGKADKALLIEGLNGRELLAMIAKPKGYDTYVVTTGKPHMFLNCKFGNSVKEASAETGSGRTIKTPGSYLELIKPESSAVAFIWNKKSFQEVWTAD